MAFLPEPDSTGHLVRWAAHLRDTGHGWMRVAQQGVQAFIGQAMGAGVPFAVETVFSHWQLRPDGTVASKVELIQQLQAAGYFRGGLAKMSSGHSRSSQWFCLLR